MVKVKPVGQDGQDWQNGPVGQDGQVGQVGQNGTVEQNCYPQDLNWVVLFVTIKIFGSPP